MKKICFVYPKSMTLPKYFNVATNISTEVNETLPPLGILYVIANSKYNIDFIDNRVENYSSDNLFNKLKAYDIVGFGGTIFEIKEARKLSHRLMKKGVLTIYAGPNATINWNLYIGDFNIILRGEAEYIIDDIFQNINSLEGLGFTKVQNTYFNKVIFRIKHLDKLKFPARSKINLNNYRRKEPNYLGENYPIDTIASSRGCPFDCYFCSSKLIWQQKYTYRSVDNIIDEIRYMMSNYGTKGVYFREDNFTTKRSRLLEFCQKVKFLNLTWMCESRVDTLDEETISLMAKAGCRGIWFGIESTDNKVLKRINKNFTYGQAKKTISLCNKYGIISGGGFMIGFPFDTKQSIIRNIKGAKRSGLKVKFFNRVWAIPHSKMHSEVIINGLDDYSFENIVLPATYYLSADKVNSIYYKHISRKSLFFKKVKFFVGRKRIQKIKHKFPFLFKVVKKFLRILPI